MGVVGPHAGDALSHGADVLFHRSTLDGVSAEGKFSLLHSMRKYLEKWYGIADVLEFGVQTDSGAKSLPHDPLGIVCLCVTSRHAGCHGLPDSTVVSA